jgi:hypothetical protein
LFARQRYTSAIGAANGNVSRTATSARLNGLNELSATIAAASRRDVESSVCCHGESQRSRLVTAAIVWSTPTIRVVIKARVLNSSGNSLGVFGTLTLSRKEAFNQDRSLKTSPRNSRRMREMARIPKQKFLDDRDPRPAESQHTLRIAPMNVAQPKP